MPATVVLTTSVLDNSNSERAFVKHMTFFFSNFHYIIKETFTNDILIWFSYPESQRRGIFVVFFFSPKDINKIQILSVLFSKYCLHLAQSPS